MRIVRFQGGLGNQMFQYAFYEALKFHQKGIVLADIRAYKFNPCHNGFEIHSIFNSQLDYSISSYTWYKILNYITGRKLYIQDKQVGKFDSSYLEKKNAIYDGFWQTEKYFLPVENKIRKIFQFNTSLNDLNKEILEKIQLTDSVSIHVRRGDYLEFSCALDKNYYYQALNYLESKIKSATFFIFSDDILWCKEHLNFQNSYYIDWNSGAESYIDMQLMSSCKHNVIANSSFSWWGAWLNKNPDKIVIAPQKWFNAMGEPDIIPESWIKI
ncbi:alpha-1,2-fucosyltransferase [Bacteroidia bacterium]|nr:alpha-1,2-fucosyltransferase [Bacteroidia bacterium]